MATILTVPSGYSDSYVPTSGELSTLATALSGVNVSINQAAESFPVEYQSYGDVAAFVNNGGIYIDYCGWPMYWPYGCTSIISCIGSVNQFGHFLSTLGADQAYCDGFDTSGCQGYPYNRSWLTRADISSLSGLIYGINGSACSSGEMGYPMVAVKSVYSKGIYIYGAAGSNGAVDPSTFAQFILSVIPAGGGTNTGGGGSTGGTPTLQQQCQAQGNVWYEGVCMTPAQYCVFRGGTYTNGQCQYPQGGGGTTPPTTSKPNIILWVGGGLAVVGLGVLALTMGGRK